MDDSTLTIEPDNSITLDTIQIEGDGITMKKASSDPSRKINFDRVSSSSTYNLNFVSMASLDWLFQRTTAGVTDARTTVTTEPSLVLIDATESGYSFTNPTTTISLDAGQSLQILWSALSNPTGTHTITINEYSPCFLNFTAGPDLWENCKADEDWLKFALAPFEWVTGGYFSFLIVGLFVVMVYQKYQKVVYPIMIGIFMLPISYFLIPSQFYIWAVLMVGVTFGILMWYVFIRQTKEWS